MTKVQADPNGRNNHWLVDGHLVAGPATAEDAIRTWEEARQPCDPAPTADDVRAEASRRMQIFVGARDAANLQIKIMNVTREGLRLRVKKDEQGLDESEVVRADALRQMDVMIEAIRAASNILEENPPMDYADDKRWPSFS